MACRGEYDDDSLATLNIYNIDAVDPQSVTQQHRSQRSKSAKQRPISAKTDPKTGRLIAGKITRPASAKVKRPSETPTRTASQLALSGISTCQPYYYDSSPAESFRQYHTSSSVTPVIPVTPVTPDVPVTPLGYGQYPFQQTLDDFHSQGSALRVPYSTPEPIETLSDDSQTERKSVHQSEEFDNSLDQSNQRIDSSQMHLLNLALPDVNDSADEGEDEIDTLRLLDDLNINLSGGTVAVSITPELRAKLASTKVTNTSQGSDSESGPAVDKVELDGPPGLNGPPSADVRLDMEREIESMLSLHRSTNKPDVQSAVRQSKDCWGNDLSPRGHNELESDNEEDENSLHSSVTSDDSSTADNPVALDPDSDSHKEIPVEDTEGTVTPATSNVGAESLPVPGDRERSSSVEKERNGGTQAADLDGLLYRWNIDVTKSNQVGEVEVPLFDRRKDYDAIDDEIDRRVEEIERQLAEQIAESELAISKLESDVSNTKFKIPEFCEIANQPVVAQTTTSSTRTRPPSTGFTLQRTDVNIPHQANKLGLKHRDVSKVFRAVTPRKKYVSSGEGKVNLSNVSSRINSGLKKKRVSSAKAEVKVNRASDTTTDELCVAGNAGASSKSKMAGEDVNLGKQTVQKSVSFHPSLKVHEPAPMKKAIKTFTFSEGGEVEEDTRTTQPIQPRSAPTRYQIPTEVNSHMSKCIKKPPPTPQPSNKRSEQHTMQGSDRAGRQPRVRSAPVSRKLSRERSAERKLTNGFTNTVSPAEVEKRAQSTDSKSPSKVAGADKSNHCKSARREHRQQDVPTAMELIRDDNLQFNSVGTFDSPDTYGETQEGGLSGTSPPTRPFSAHPITKKASAPVKRAQSAPVKRRVGPHTTPTNITTTHKCIEREDAEQLQQLANVHDKVSKLGVELDRSMIDRALFPPTNQSVKSCQQQMGRHLHTAGLLSSPEKWLKEEYRSLKKAKQELQRYERGLISKKKKSAAKVEN